jgi:NADPH:quinone reductase
VSSAVPPLLDEALHAARMSPLSARHLLTRIYGTPMVGGPQLVAAYERLAAGGTLVSVGHATDQGEHFPFGTFFGNEGRHDRSIVTFYLLDCPNVGPDLAWLAVAAGRIDPQIAWRGSWKDVADATGAMLERRLHGKAVLEID